MRKITFETFLENWNLAKQKEEFVWNLEEFVCNKEFYICSYYFYKTNSNKIMPVVVFEQIIHFNKKSMKGSLSWTCEAVSPQEKFKDLHWFEIMLVKLLSYRWYYF